MFKPWMWEILAVGIVIFLLFIVLVFPARSEEAIEGNIENLNIRVMDGDTFHILNPRALAGTLDIDRHKNRYGALEIRIQGIDAPEKKQWCYVSGERFDCAKDAKVELERLLSSGLLYCVKSGTSYNRVVMRCMVDNDSVGARMVRGGYAFFDPNPKYTSGIYRMKLWASEIQARVEGLGVWRQDRIEFPWDWRKNN